MNTTPNTWSVHWIDASGQTWWLTPEWEWASEYDARFRFPTSTEAHRFLTVAGAGAVHYDGDCPGSERCGAR